MKKIILILGMAVAALGVTSCERDTTALNVDPKHPETLPSYLLLATAQQQQFYYVSSPNVNQGNFVFLTQQIAETTYTDETNYDLVTRNQPRNFFNRMYDRVLKNYSDAMVQLEKEGNTPAVQNNKWATLEISSVYAWEVLVDTYGNVPYSEALKAPAVLSPKYDDAKTIYTSLLTRLDAAIAKIDTNADGYASDYAYHGDMNKWKRLANSIKLRLAMNLADVDAAASKTAAESAIASGVLASNADNYAMSFDGSQFKSPFHDELVASGRFDFVPTKLVMDYMNANNDPRIPILFNPAVDGANAGQYPGGTFGSLNAYTQNANLGNKTTGKYFSSATGPITLLSYAEVMFLRTEAAARGYNAGGTAATLFSSAIQASMDQYKVTPASAAVYKAAVVYDAVNWKRSIGKEAFIALFGDQAFASWNFIRRLDNPVMVNPANSRLDGVPVRLPYSDQEYVLNPANVKAAATAIGGDNALTKLFWDKF